MVQIRTKNFTCNTNFKICVNPNFEESKESFGPNNKYIWSNNDNGYSFDGPTGDGYPKSGFVQILSPNTNISQQNITDLKVTCFFWFFVIF
jgi:hypothetical protein